MPKKAVLIIESLALPFAVLAISCSAILVRFSGAPALVIAAYRLAFTIIFIGPPVLLFKRGELARLGRRDLALASVGGLFLAGHFYSWIASLALTSVAHSVLFVSTAPLFVIVASRFLLGERVSRGALLGAFLAIVGILMISGGSFQAAYQTLPGDFLALTGAVLMAGYLLVGRSLRPRLSTLTYTFIVYSSAALFLVITALLAGTPLYPYPPGDYLIFVALALVPTIMGHSVFNWALKRYSATLVSLLFLGEPIGASLLAWLIFFERPASFFFPGAALILAGLALVVTGGGRRVRGGTEKEGPAAPP